MYSSWSKIGAGAYATVFECSTNFIEPPTVAIKQLTFPNSIFGRCVLYDIFSEITSLEELRAEKCTTTLYDYGVDDNNYFVVMKRYAYSLREWRRKQSTNMNDNLSLYMTLFKQILKAVEVVHSHNVTHYDLKCDNVMLEMCPSAADDAEEVKVALGDFGVCKLFTNEDDEYDLKPRGTQYIQSPEMLTLAKSVKKDGDKYDRRKKVGTTRTSDIWSLGCLFYELLTGEYLFFGEEEFEFFIHVTSPDTELLLPEKRTALNNNTYLIDFLKYMLVRDPTRPNINNVLARFKHVHALVVNASVAPIIMSPTSPTISSIRGKAGVESLLESCANIMFPISESIPEKVSSGISC